MNLLPEPAVTPAVQALFDEDLAELGFVMNASRLWAYRPEWQERIFELLGSIVKAHGLTFRQRGILVAACASAMGDSYCSVAWGTKLAGVSDPDLAAGVLSGDDHGLTEAEQALANWARQVARHPNATTVADVDALRSTGWTNEQIFGITVFTAIRIAFSTVNDALGAQPDGEFHALAPTAILDAITYGRPLNPAPGP